MKRVFRVEVEADPDHFAVDESDIKGAVLDLADGYATTSALHVKVVELKAAQPTPVVNLGPTKERTNIPTGNPRHCNTEKLLELIRMDPLCDAYRRVIRADESPLDPNGNHLLVMLLAAVNAEASRQILTHRVEVMAKLSGSMKPYCFMLEIPAAHWDKLKEYKS